jgi:dTDP-4-dehydrorhamnose reductase
MKVAIIGKTGQLGSDLNKILSHHHELLDLPRDQIDLNTDIYHKYFQNLDFDILINTAAIHNINYAEENPSEAFQVNSNAPYELAKICKEIKFLFIFRQIMYLMEKKKHLTQKKMNAIL